MQMKIIVDTPEDYKKWLKDKATVVQEVKAANTPAPEAGQTPIDTSKTQKVVVATNVAMK